MTKTESERLKTRILSILEDGQEYTRTTLATLAAGEEFTTMAGQGAVVALDLEDRVSVRVTGDGVAYYSKAKPKEKSRVTFPTAFSKRGALMDCVSCGGTFKLKLMKVGPDSQSMYCRPCHKLFVEPETLSTVHPVITAQTLPRFRGAAKRTAK